MKKLVIAGGGFAGVWAALAASNLRRRHGAVAKDFRISLVSRDPWLTIRPRLYEDVLDDVRVPLDEVLGPAGVERIQGDITRIDAAARAIVVTGGGHDRALQYDRLVLAAGSRAHRAAIPGAEHALSVDTYREAAALGRHLAALPSMEAAPEDGRFTAVIVGAGFTGIEVATSLVARLRALAARAHAAERVRVVVVERGPAVAPDLGAGARRHIQRVFAELGIEARTAAAVSAIGPDGVTLNSSELIPAATIVWTGGLRASDLGAQLGVERDAAGRVPVDEYLRVRGVHSVYAAGDMARAMADREGGHIAPMSCQCAIPMGELAGHNAASDLFGLSAIAYAHSAYVTCLDLGEAGALFMEGWDREVRLTGFWAKVVKETINTRLIYPPRLGHVSRAASEERSAA
jgi:NADH:quinone reductase (non-electrogenic)